MTTHPDIHPQEPGAEKLAALRAAVDVLQSSTATPEQKAAARDYVLAVKNYEPIEAQKSKAAALLGSISTPKKAAASRANGAKGGRPPGRKALPVTIIINRPPKATEERLREIIKGDVCKPSEAARSESQILDELFQEGGEE